MDNSREGPNGRHAPRRTQIDDGIDQGCLAAQERNELARLFLNRAQDILVPNRRVAARQFRFRRRVEPAFDSR